MAKYDKFDRDKYADTFDNMFGTGSYERGMSSARTTGQKKVEASLARKAYNERQKEIKKAADKAAKEKAKKDAVEKSMAPADSKKKEDKKGDNALDKLVSGTKKVAGGAVKVAKKVAKEVSRFDDRIGNAMSFGLLGEADKRIEKQYENKDKDVDMTSYMERRQDGNIVGKGADLVADIMGMGATGIGAVGALRGLGATGKGINALTQAHKAGTVTKPLLKRAALDSLKEGALVGGAMAIPESAVRLGLNRESDTTFTDELKHVGLNVALGGALDPLTTIAAPALKMASRSAVDNMVGGQAADNVISGLRQAKRNPAAAGDVIQEQMRQGSTIAGIRNQSAADRMMKMLAQSQQPSPRSASPLEIQNPQANEARRVMDEISSGAANSNKALHPRSAEKNLEQLITNTRRNVPEPQTNRGGQLPVEPKVNASDSEYIPSKYLQNARAERDALVATNNPESAGRLQALGNQIKALEEQDVFRQSAPKVETSDPKIQKLLEERERLTNMPYFSHMDKILIGRIDTEISDLMASQVVKETAATVPPTSTLTETSEPTNILAQPQQAADPLEGLANPNPVRGEFDAPAQESELVDLVDRTVYKPKTDPKVTATKLQQQFTNDAAGLRQIDQDMKALDADGLMKYLNPKTYIKSRTKALAADSSVEKSMLNAKGAHSVAANHTTQRYEPFLKSLNGSKTTDLKELGEYAASKRTLKLLEDSADSRAARDSLVSEIEAMKRTLGADAPEVKSMEEMLENYTSYRATKNATPEQLQLRIAQSEQKPELVQFYNQFMDLQQQNLKDMHEGGILGKELYDRLAADKTYISMHRNFGAETSTNYMASRRPQNPLERLKGGSEAMIKDPVQEAIRNAYVTRFNIEKNNALKVVEKFAKIDKDAVMFKGVKQSNVNTITIFANGKPKHYEVPPALKNYVDNISPDMDPDVLTNSLQKLAQMQRKLTTQYSLSFQLKSLVREPVQAIMTSRTAKSSVHAVKNTALGYVDAFFGPQLQNLTKDLPKHLQFNSYKPNWDSMGGTGYQLIRMSDDDLQRTAKDLMEGSTVKGNVKKLNPFRALGKFGENVEGGARLGEFRSAKNQGYSDADAFYEATDITNYKRTGKSTATANKYMPFLNATIQGNARVARAFQEAPAKTIARGVTMLTSTSAAVYGMRYMDGVSDEQRQELKNLNQWEKDMYLHIPSPLEGDDTIYALPKAFAVGQMFMNPMERALDDYTDSVMKEESVPQHVKAGVMSTLKSFVPPYEVAGLTTGYELLQNKSLFSGQEIENKFDKDAGVPKKDIEAYNQSYLTKIMADALNYMAFSPEGDGWVSPAQMDYLIKDFTGSVGTRSLEMSDHALKDNAPVKPLSDQLAHPFKQFVADPTRASGAYTELQKLAKVEKRSNTPMTGMSEDEKNEERSNRGAQNYEAAFKDINKEIQAIRNDKSKTSQEKKDEITALRKEQDSLGSRGFDWYNSFK